LSTRIGLTQPEFHLSNTVAGPDEDVLWGMLAAETQLTHQLPLSPSSAFSKPSPQASCKPSFSYQAWKQFSTRMA